MAFKTWNGLPVLEPDMDLPAVTQKLQGKLSGDFCVAANFEPDFVARLIREGYLTTAERVGSREYVLMPKLHVHRCIIRFQDLKVQRHTRKRGRLFEMTVDQCFEEVVKKCVQQHGENWLHPPLQRSLISLHGHRQGLHGVRMHSVEVWQGNKLVAGEIGSSVGAVYTSFTGFSNVSSSGSVQCTALGLLLERAGFRFWDLGMSIAYKVALGGTVVPRHRFLVEYRLARDCKIPPLQLARTNADEIFKFRITDVKPQQANPNSKRQQKKRARLQRRQEAKAKKRAERELAALHSQKKNPPRTDP